MTILRALLVGWGLLALGGGAAEAHPHVLITNSVAPVIDEQGRVTALDLRWEFDAAYSAFTAADLKGRKGAERAAELDKFARETLENLAEWGYYADLEAGGKRLAVGTAGNGAATLDDGILVLRFRLPLKDPLAIAGQTLAVRVYDPTYYIAIEMDVATAVRLPGSWGERCKTRLREPAKMEYKSLSESAYAAEADKKTDMRDGIGFALAQVAEITCK